MEKTLLSLFLIYFLSISASAYSPHHEFVNCTAINNISNIVYSPCNSNFTTILSAYVRNKRYNRSDTRKPTLILTPTEEVQVSTIVRCAKASNIHLKIRSGGHDYDGSSYVSKDHFVILDMFNLRSISIDAEIQQTAWVGAGASLGELYYKIRNTTEFLAFPGGDCPTVGIGGHISGGGFGNMLRKYGLAADHVRDAKIVVADGSILNKSSMGEDLFWAILGGGGASFCVILSYQLNLVPIPPDATVFSVERFMSDNASGILYDYQTIAPRLDDTIFIRAIVQPVTINDTKQIRTTYVGMFLGDAERLMNEIITPNFPSLGLNAADCKQMTWIDSVLYWAKIDNSSGGREALLNRTSVVEFLKQKSDYVKTAIPLSNLTDMFEAMLDVGEVGMVFNPYGGEMNLYSESDTPFPHRSGNLFNVQYVVKWENASKEAEDAHVKQIRKLYDYMTPYVSDCPRESYLNYRDSDIGTNDGQNNYTLGEVYGRSYFKSNFDRLVRVKTAVDPDNFFRNEQSIPTLPTKPKDDRSKVD